MTPPFSSCWNRGLLKEHDVTSSMISAGRGGSSMCIHNQMLACTQVLFYHSISGDHREAEFIFLNIKITLWSQPRKASNTHSCLTHLSSRLCGNSTWPAPCGSLRRLHVCFCQASRDITTQMASNTNFLAWSF